MEATYGIPTPCQGCGMTIYRRHVNSKVPKQCPQCREKQKREFWKRVKIAHRSRIQGG